MGRRGREKEMERMGGREGNEKMERVVGKVGGEKWMGTEQRVRARINRPHFASRSIWLC